jgi:hypothetical protein
MVNIGGVLVVWAICVVLPLVTWGTAEFRGGKRGRPASAKILVAVNLTLALVAMLAANFLTRLNYNMWYSCAASQLVESVVTELEEKRVDEVVVELKRLDDEFNPTYEHLGRWDELVEETVARLTGPGQASGTLE